MELRQNIVFTLLLLSLSIQAKAETTCNEIDSCTCDMSDGSGQVNLKGIGSTDGYDSQFTLSGGDGWMYKYNPCFGYTWAYYYDLAVVQTNKDGTYGFDLGNQTSARFAIAQGGEVTIHYISTDGDRTSRILLMCDRKTNEHTLEFLGELIVTEYDFILNSPCACPGYCNNNGIINPVEVVPTNDPNGVNINVNNNNPNNVQPSSSFMWTDVGGAMVALIFHDLLLVIIIASVVALVKHGRNESNQQPVNAAKQNPRAGFSPHDVITTTSGQQAQNNTYATPNNVPGYANMSNA